MNLYGTALETARRMIRALFIGFLFSSVSAEAQEVKASWRIWQNDTASYFIKLSSETPFTIDSLKFDGGPRLEFFPADQEVSCKSIVCEKPGDYLISFKQQEIMSPMAGERRVKKNSQYQPTSDFQKGVVVFTRHGKKFKRIAIATYTEAAPSDPNILPSIPRSPAISGDR